jgi:hypothetical protein
MAFKVQRKTFRLGTSRAIVLPSSWCNYYSDRLDKVIILEDGVLVIAPAGLEEKAQAMIDQYQNNKGGNSDG